MLIGKSETAGVQLQTPREPPTVASVMDALKGVCLIPVTGMYVCIHICGCTYV